jgi:hypothetical protein
MCCSSFVAMHAFKLFLSVTLFALTVVNGEGKKINEKKSEKKFSGLPTIHHRIDSNFDEDHKSTFLSCNCNQASAAAAVSRSVNCDNNSRPATYQGCQMVCLQTKDTNLGKFWRVLQW